MASPRTQRALKALKLHNENHKCLECGSRNPQWVSVTYGTWICLECSGKHRGLGVHLSFVRSITMDKWKDAEIEKMKVGGNQKFKEFIDEHLDDKGKGMNLNEKYNSSAAALYRDKINSLSQGLSWDLTEAKQKINKASKPPYVSTFKDTQTSYSSNYSTQFNDKNEIYYGGHCSANANSPINNAFLKEETSIVDNALTNFNTGWSLLSDNASKLLVYSSEKVAKLGSQTGTKALELGNNLNEMIGNKEKLNETLSSHTKNLMDLTYKATNMAKLGINDASQFLTTKCRDIKFSMVKSSSNQENQSLNSLYGAAKDITDDEDENHFSGFVDNRVGSMADKEDLNFSKNKRNVNNYGGLDSRDESFGVFNFDENNTKNSYNKKTDDNWESW